MSRHYDLITEMRNLPFNIKNIFDWSKVLWNNFDWGGDFLLEIIEYKLKRMKRYMEVDTCIWEESAQDDIDQISSCLEACRYLISNNFESDLAVKHYDKYPIEWMRYTDEKGLRHTTMQSMGEEEKIEFDEMQEMVKRHQEKYKHQLFDTLREKYNWWGD